MYRHRQEAGQKLVPEVKEIIEGENTVVLGLPRGGVPVAYEVAKALELPLDVFVVRKLGVPGQEELAMGAIASGGVRFLNQDIFQQLNISDQQLEEITERERQELKKRENIYRGTRPEVDLEGKETLIIDDGLATGATMKAAVNALREHSPARILAAVPTAPPEPCREMQELVDEMICLSTPANFMGVGGSYREFGQTTNEEVKDLLEQAQEWMSDAQTT